MYLAKTQAPPAFRIFWPRESHSLLASADRLLADRLAASTLIGSADFDARVAPYTKWVTEIGLRPSHEVRQTVGALVGTTPVARLRDVLAPLESFDHFSRDLAERAGVDPGAEFDHDRWARDWLGQGEHQVVTHTIAQYVDGVGSQADALAVSAGVAGYEPRLERTGTAAFLILHAACAFAVVGDDRCRALFDRAEYRMTAGWDRFFVLLRSLTAEVKRLDGSRADEVHDRASRLARTLAETYGDAAGDLAFALLSNMDALRARRSGNHGLAAELVNRARDLVRCATGGDTGYPWQIASRYHVQICQNWVRTRLANPATADDAVRELERLIGYCRTDEPASLAEALNLYGLALFQLGRPEAAIAPLEEAERLLTGDISLIRRNTVVGTLIAALDALDRSGDVERWVGELRPGDELLDRLLTERG